MHERWQLRVTDGERLVYAVELTGPAEIGRQLNPDEALPSHTQKDGRWRVVIASLKENTVSRKHLEVLPLPEGRFMLFNRSAAQQIDGLPSGPLMPGESCEVSQRAVVQLGGKTVRLQAPEEEPEALESLVQATVAPGAGSLMSSLQASIARSDGSSAMETGQLVRWIQTFLGLLQSAAGSEDFFAKAATALVDLVKLDSGRILLRAGERWEEKATQLAPGVERERDWRPSTRVLTSVLSEKKTFWQIPRGGVSTRGIEAVVAAPILNRHGEVIGALYGERGMAGVRLGARNLTSLDAMLVEVLASGVAAGLSRLEQEQAAMRTRTQMEQFFTPVLAARLVEHPELLRGRETTVSVLICDLRGFSRISERLGPTRTVEWVSDVMSELSQCVLDHEGVVVDYIGDEMMAMWGAPADQPDHAQRACRAGLAMFARLPKLNERWQAQIQEPLDIGIGVNTGVAQVGNVGSRVKFKYGALGNTVNLASRVQGATKYLQTPLLITAATRAALDKSFQAQTRRLCQVRVVNIAEPVALYELIGPGNDTWIGLKLAYEEALDKFTAGEFRVACRILGRLIPDHPDDGPSLLLLSRAVAFLINETDTTDPVFTLPGK
jgi:adenylate cyclase